MKVYLAGTETRPYVIGSRWRDDIVNLFLAKSGGMWSAYFSPNSFTRANILQSFFYVNKFTEEIILPNCKSFLLDSGAFTFMENSKIKVDWEEYAEKYADWVNKHDIKLFFELDIDAIVGYGKVKIIRAKLEKLTNKQPIPVWHTSRGKEEFIRMCEEYKYVAIGGIVSKEIKPEQYQAFTWLIKTAHQHGAKIHGLGFTSLEGIKKYHFDSVDSTAWTTGNRFGYVYQFNGKTMIKHDTPKGHKLGDTRMVAIHNFTEWAKFAEYAEEHF